MNRFLIYLEMGLDHILAWNGQDHLLFLVALVAFYRFDQMKQILLLITAFTIGHSVSLAIASIYLIPISGYLLGFLIPFTILLACFYNLYFSEWNPNFDKEALSTWNHPKYHYLITLLFGMIHGMGFANYFDMISRKSESIIFPLFAFNIGVEIGQVIFISGLLLIYWLVSRLFPIVHKYWNLALTSLAAILAIRLFMVAYLSS